MLVVFLRAKTRFCSRCESCVQEGFQDPSELWMASFDRNAFDKGMWNYLHRRGYLYAPYLLLDVLVGLNLIDEKMRNRVMRHIANDSLTLTDAEIKQILRIVRDVDMFNYLKRMRLYIRWNST